MLNIYHLEPIDPQAGPWEKWHDRCFGMVIIHASEELARHLATADPGREGGEVWLDPSLTRCTQIGICVIPENLTQSLANSPRLVLKDEWKS